MIYSYSCQYVIVIFFYHGECHCTISLLGGNVRQNIGACEFAKQGRVIVIALVNLQTQNIVQQGENLVCCFILIWF